MSEFFMIDFRVITKNRKKGYLIEHFNTNNYEYRKKCSLTEKLYKNPVVLKSVLIKNFENFGVNLIKYLKRKSKDRLKKSILKFEFAHDIFRLIFGKLNLSEGWFIVEENFFDGLVYLKKYKKIKSQINCFEEINFQ